MLNKFNNQLAKIEKYWKYLILVLIILILPVLYLFISKLWPQNLKHNNIKTVQQLKQLHYTAYPKYAIPAEENVKFITLGLTADGKQVLLNHKTTKLLVLNPSGGKLLSVVLGQNQDLKSIKMAALSVFDENTAYIAALGEPPLNNKVSYTKLFIYKISTLPGKAGLEFIKSINIPQAGQYIQAARAGEFWVSSVYIPMYFLPDVPEIAENSRSALKSNTSLKDVSKQLENKIHEKSNYTTRIQIKDNNIKVTSLKTSYDYMPMYWGSSDYTILVPFSPLSIKQIAVINHKTNTVTELTCPDISYYIDYNFTGSNLFYILQPLQCKNFSELQNGFASLEVNSKKQNQISINMLPENIQKILPRMNDLNDATTILNFIFFKLGDETFVININNSMLTDLTNNISEKIDIIGPASDEQYVLAVNNKLGYADILVNNATILRVYKTQLK